MTKAKPKNDRGRVMVYLDQDTLNRLDTIVQRAPDIDNRSAAIRYASRIALEQLEKKK